MCAKNLSEAREGIHLKIAQKYELLKVKADKRCTVKTMKLCWEKLKRDKISRDILCRSEDSLLLYYRFSPKCSV